ncbi:MAG: hypothetical protein ACK4ZJ_17540, partial [Allorhizobium sp.]
MLATSPHPLLRAVTDNPLHEAKGGYEHVAVVQDVDVPDVDFLRSLSAIQGSSQRGDMLDAVVV